MHNIRRCPAMFSDVNLPWKLDRQTALVRNTGSNPVRVASIVKRPRKGKCADANLITVLNGQSVAPKAMSRKIQLILNGKVAGNDALNTAIARQRAVGHTIEVRVTSEKGDARRFVAEAGEVDLVIAAGGDGTLNEVVHGLMDLSSVPRPVLGGVPLGTANDFAMGCGIPRDPDRARTIFEEGYGIAI